MENRLFRITQCMDELADCRAHQHIKTFSVLLWEMDWLAELHRLIWEYEDAEH